MKQLKPSALESDPGVQIPTPLSTCWRPQGRDFKFPYAKPQFPQLQKCINFKVVVSIKINVWYITGIHM